MSGKYKEWVAHSQTQLHFHKEVIPWLKGSFLPRNTLFNSCDVSQHVEKINKCGKVAKLIFKIVIQLIWFELTALKARDAKGEWGEEMGGMRRSLFP